jgi:parallel beta-helix repeat protein
MKRRTFLISFLVFLSTFYLAFAIVPDNVKAATLFVGGSGPGNYTTIQNAIDAAFAGDTVFVFNGTYNEDLEVYKALNLVGEDRNATIVGVATNFGAVTITANSVKVDGFTVEAGPSSTLRYGIYLQYADNCVISGNVLRNSRAGIALYQSNINTINDNLIYANSNGIRVSSSSQNVIANNTIHTSNYSGIILASSDNTTITSNTFTDDGIYIWAWTLENWNTHVIDTSNTVNGRPVYYWKDAAGGTVPSDAGQVILSNSTGVIVENLNLTDTPVSVQMGFSSYNTIANNTGSGGYIQFNLQNSSHNVIVNNTIRDTIDGMRFSGSNSNRIVGNKLSNTTWYGIVLNYVSYNTFTDNKMVKGGIFLDGDSVIHWNTHEIDSSNTVNGRPVRYLNCQHFGHGRGEPESEQLQHWLSIWLFFG